MTFSTTPTVFMTNSTDRVEIITSVQRRRRWTAPEKVRMVEETFEPGAVARKLAVILHRMWIDRTEFNWSKKEVAA